MKKYMVSEDEMANSMEGRVVPFYGTGAYWGAACKGRTLSGINIPYTANATDD